MDLFSIRTELTYSRPLVENPSQKLCQFIIHYDISSDTKKPSTPYTLTREQFVQTKRLFRPLWTWIDPQPNKHLTDHLFMVLKNMCYDLTLGGRATPLTCARQIMGAVMSPKKTALSTAVVPDTMELPPSGGVDIYSSMWEHANEIRKNVQTKILNRTWTPTFVPLTVNCSQYVGTNAVSGSMYFTFICPVAWTMVTGQVPTKSSISGNDLHFWYKLLVGNEKPTSYNSDLGVVFKYQETIHDLINGSNTQAWAQAAIAAYMAACNLTIKQLASPAMLKLKEVFHAANLLPMRKAKS